MPPTIDKGSNMVILLRELKARSLDVHDCAKLLRIARRNALRYLKHLHEKKPPKVWISGWNVPPQGPATAIYSLVPEKAKEIPEDVPRPAARAPSERKRDIRKKRRAIRALVKGDPLLSLFFKKPRRRRKRPAE